MKNTHPIRVAALFFALLIISAASIARVTYPVDPAYEDTVRIVVLWSNSNGICGETAPVGALTRDFVVAAIDTSACHQVKVVQLVDYEVLQNQFPGAVNSYTRVSQIQALWPGKLPHVIIHINAGWGIFNGPTCETILGWAYDNALGVVEIGDDGTYMTTSIFGWTQVPEINAPMYTATYLNKAADSLFIRLKPANDVGTDENAYPGLKGVIKNAAKITTDAGTDSTLYFKPVGGFGRCEADADSLNIIPAAIPMMTFLGYQMGYNSTADSGNPFPQGSGDGDIPVGYVGNPGQFECITTIKETDASAGTVRRGTYLGFQPQFLANEDAAKQLVYDAIMWASLGRPAVGTSHQPKAFQNSSMQITSIANVIRGQERQFDVKIAVPGQTISVSLELFDANGKTLGKQKITQPKAGMVTATIGTKANALGVCFLRVRSIDESGAQKSMIKQLMMR